MPPNPHISSTGIVEINGCGYQPLIIYRDPFILMNIGGRDLTEQQMELFWACCLIRGRWAEFFIDSRSSTCLVAQRRVRDLQLHTEPMAWSSQLSWVVDGPNLIVYEQCLIWFIVSGHYLDYVWCDVMPVMNAHHLLLRKPCQFDRGVIYNGWENS